MNASADHKKLEIVTRDGRKAQLTANKGCLVGDMIEGSWDPMGFFNLHASLRKKKKYNETTPFFQCSTSSDLSINHAKQKSNFGKMRHTHAHTHTHIKTTTQTSVINWSKDINK